VYTFRTSPYYRCTISCAVEAVAVAGVVVSVAGKAALVDGKDFSVAKGVPVANKAVP
jgi:hypothetical protein